MLRIAHIFSCVAFKEIYYLRARIHFTNIETILAVMYTTELELEVRPEKSSSPYGLEIHNLYDTGAALYQLS